MIDRGVVYLMLGIKHLPVLAVSVHSLRKHWTGAVTIYVDENALPVVSQLGKAADIEVLPFDVHKQRRHTGYANKPRVPAVAAQQYRQTIQLDADTMVVGDFGELWPAHNKELVITHYADWVSTGKRLRKRINVWAKVLPNLAAKQSSIEHPAINTGIVAYGCDSDVALEHWLAATLRNPTVFMSDELAMQLIFAEFPHVRVVDDRWNWSPIYGTKRGRKDARVIHFHGRKHLRAEALPFWLPEFEEAMAENYGGIREWVPAGDNRLKAYLAGTPAKETNSDEEEE